MSLASHNIHPIVCQSLALTLYPLDNFYGSGAALPQINARNQATINIFENSCKLDSIIDPMQFIDDNPTHVSNSEQQNCTARKRLKRMNLDV